ncbi:hypothetical protein NKG05_03105 [Oerskovia sp. M15]
MGGIEGRLTAIWSLTYYTRHLAHAVERAIATGTDLTSEDWARLSRITSENISALTAVLDDRLPRRSRRTSTSAASTTRPSLRRASRTWSCASSSASTRRSWCSSRASPREGPGRTRRRRGRHSDRAAPGGPARSAS